MVKLVSIRTQSKRKGRCRERNLSEYDFTATIVSKLRMDSGDSSWPFTGTLCNSPGLFRDIEKESGYMYASKGVV